MSSKVVVLALAALACVQLASAGCTNSTDWDYLTLVQQWPVVDCANPAACNPTDQYFTIHGLWPSDFSGNYPCLCSNETFDINQIASLVPQMNTYWPSYNCSNQAFNGTNPEFWAHEWTKHGTCTKVLAPLSTQLQFFKTTLTMALSLDLLTLLKSANIVPGPTPVTTQSFLAAIQSGYGMLPAVGCSGGSLASVSLCMDKEFSPIPCPLYQSNSCGSQFLFPAASQVSR